MRRGGAVTVTPVPVQEGREVAVGVRGGVAVAVAVGGGKRHLSDGGQGQVVRAEGGHADTETGAEGYTESLAERRRWRGCGCGWVRWWEGRRRRMRR